MLQEVGEECEGEEGGVSDEDVPEEERGITEAEYRQKLRQHRKQRRNNEVIQCYL